MYNILEVSKYIINYSIEIESPVSNLKLQKLLYYVQAKFLIDKNKVCFENNIENWRHGPVIPQIYRSFKKYFNSNIEVFQKVNEEISYEDKKLIDTVVLSYKLTEAWEMVDKTHNEEPWKSTNRNEIITTESIENYFLEKRDRIMG